MPIEQAEFGGTGHQGTRVIFGSACLAVFVATEGDERTKAAARAELHRQTR